MKFIKPFFYFSLFFVCWLLLVSLLWPFPKILLLTMIFISLVYFFITKRKNDLIIYFVSAIAGPIGESVVSASGLWTYHGETLFGVPYWLPFAWGITAVAVYKLILEITK